MNARDSVESLVFLCMFSKTEGRVSSNRERAEIKSLRFEVCESIVQDGVVVVNKKEQLRLRAGEAKAGQNVELRVDKARLAEEKSLPDFNKV